MLNYKLGQHRIMKFLAAIMALAVSLALGGCSLNEISEQVTDTVAGTTAANTIGHLQQNNITTELVEMENFSDNAPTEYLYTSVKVSGLKDESVQTKINQTIEAKYDELLAQTLPGYRGLSSFVDTSAQKDTEIISTTVTGSFNNILSIYMIKKVRQGGINYVDNQTLNFDLRTGELIELKDLFKDEDCTALNSYIAQNLKVFGNVYGGGNIHDETQDYYMITMFKGVPDDQKFYIDESGIVLLMDYTNPEIYMTKYDAYKISVGYDKLEEYLNLDSFLDTEESIYTDATVKYMIPYGTADALSKETSVPEGSSNLDFAMSFVYTEGIPETALQKGEELCTFDDEKVNKLKTEAAAHSEYQYGYTNNISGKQIGKYYNLVQSISYYQANFRSETKYAYVYDMKGNPIELADVFVEGFDYETVIKNSIKEKLQDDFPDGSYDGKTIDDIYAEISFYIDVYGLQVQTRPIKFEDAYESSVSVFIPYESFGCDQMTIFN